MNKGIIFVILLIMNVSTISFVNAAQCKFGNFTACKQEALKGDSFAQFNLGVMYYNGTGVTQDYKEAVKWYSEAAKLQNPYGFQNRSKTEAQYNLGMMYAKGQGVTQDYEKAAYFFKLTANALVLDEYSIVDGQKVFKRFYPPAQAGYNLGMMYYDGTGVTQDYKEAVKWYSKAANQGNVDAQFYLGMMYYDGAGVTQDYKEAVKWYSKAANQGLAEAQYNLGGMYNLGKGVTQDYKETVKWYSKAANQGLVEAQYNLGGMYNFGVMPCARLWLRLSII